jgi:hypothetical protein
MRELLHVAITERNAQTLLIVNPQRAIEGAAKTRRRAKEARREFAEEMA